MLPHARFTIHAALPETHQFTEKNGRRPTDNEVAVLVRETRADKLIEISTDEVRSRQRSRLTRNDAKVLSELRENASSRDLGTESAEPSLRHAEDHVFERVSVARDHEILTEALRHGRGHIDHSELKGTSRCKRHPAPSLRIATRSLLPAVSSVSAK